MKKLVNVVFLAVLVSTILACTYNKIYAIDSSVKEPTDKDSNIQETSTASVVPDKPSTAIIQDPSVAQDPASILGTAYGTTPAYLPQPSDSPDNVSDDSAAENNHASMLKIHGAYGVSMGFTPDEFIWKKANGDWQERNWRYVFHDEDVDVYDPRIYDRYELEIETDTRTPWNAYADIVIDPWTFVAVGHERVRNAWGDIVNVEYKMWENTGYTINNDYRTILGNYITVPELKVVGNKITPFTATPPLWGDPNFLLSANRGVKLEYLYRPVRKLWVEYKETPFYLKFFPIADQAEALTSDDPLTLSNNHIYWAPSPWLWRFDPGMRLRDAGGTPFRTTQTQAMWNWDEQWFAENSNRQYMTFLRGISASWIAEDFASLDVTAATPMGLWDYYSTVTSLPIAARFKMNPTNRLMIGSTYASKYGFNFTSRDPEGSSYTAPENFRAQNQVLGFDFNYNLFKKTDIFGEYAGSYMSIRQPNGAMTDDLGNSYQIGLKSDVDLGPSNSVKWDTSFTWMSQKFAPGLSDYRDTRIDRDWGQHIWFDPLSDADQNSRIGDSVDINRYVVGANARAKIMDNLFNVYLNFRNAHETYTDKFIENIMRAEATYHFAPNIQFKGLFLDRLYHDSIGNFDPILRDRYFDTFWQNYRVQDGRDVQIVTLSGGGKVDMFERKVSVYGIYEATNDPQYFPRDVLNNVAFNTKVCYDNVLFDRLIYQVYDQDLFGLPPYSGWFNMWKGCVTITPVNNIQVRYTHVTNTNQNYAPLFDNNHTHDEVTFTYKPIRNVTWITGYSCSQLIDLKRAVDTDAGSPRAGTADIEFKPHHNIYSRIDWDFKKDQKLTFQFGEKFFMEKTDSVFGPLWFQDDVDVLDTRAIFRVWYQGKF